MFQNYLALDILFYVMDSVVIFFFVFHVSVMFRFPLTSFVLAQVDFQ
jgi:hypothetical protein